MSNENPNTISSSELVCEFHGRVECGRCKAVNAPFVEQQPDRFDEMTAEISRLVAEREKPIDMVLFCPRCGKQHVDAPEPENDWHNPPHRSHKCHACSFIWRPADVPTNGVAAIKTKGRDDSFPPSENAQYRQKLVSRGWENPETIRAARDLAEMLTRMSLGQVKYFAEIIEREVFPKMNLDEICSAANFFASVSRYFMERSIQSEEERRFPVHADWLNDWKKIRSWKTNEKYYYDLERLLCVLACQTPDCGERIGFKDCWETRRWGCHQEKKTGGF